MDSVYNSLNDTNRVSQLFMISFYPMQDYFHTREVECLVKDYQVGGVIMFKGGPVLHATMTNYLQSLSKVPMLISMDAEWGVAMRLDSVPVFPRQMVLGASDNDSMVYKIGVEIGKQCKRLGIHMNFAPVIDINNNSKNPVINDRSFGEDKFKVSRKGLAYMNGMQDHGVIACAKHFPGHGDTESDSHYSLPQISHPAARLDSLELYPFKILFDRGVKSVMIAHLYLNTYDTTTNRASSLSKKVVTDLLKDQLGYKGLVLTDALNMQGVSKFQSPPAVNLQALLAGNDILLCADQVPASIDTILKAIRDSLITWNEIEIKVKKILEAKYWSGLNNYKPVQMENLYQDLNPPHVNELIKDAVREAVVIAKNDEKLIPILRPDTMRIASVAVGSRGFTSFQNMIHNYAKMDYYFIDKNDSSYLFDSLYAKLGNYDLVIASLHSTSRFLNRKYGLTDQEIYFVNKLSGIQKLIFINHGNPYLLKDFYNLKNVIIGYEDLPLYNQLTAQVLFGTEVTSGSLPVTVNQEYKYGQGEMIAPVQRLQYVYPDEVNVDEKVLSKIDSTIQQAIASGATPGCQIIAVRDGKVFYQRSFGHNTYDKLQAVDNKQLYDLASLTKVLGTTLAVMKLYENHKISLGKKISHYLPELKNTNKKSITIEQALLHSAGLVSWIPFYQKTMYEGFPSPYLYKANKDSIYNIQVTPTLYMRNDYKDSIWNQIFSSEISKNEGQYLYSDLGFYLLKRMVEQVSKMPIEKYLEDNFYRPLNLATMTYNPLEKFQERNIVPTEFDSSFRKTLLRGTVHDQGAAMMGGIAGHAGLFSNANDVAVIMQMLLNKGSYGGYEFFKEETVTKFTSRFSDKSRRGLGFDKPETDPMKSSPAGSSASSLAFGHTGFTGTCVWADPEYNLIYVFLSNRVHPTAANDKLIKLNVRTRIHDQIYEAIKKGGVTSPAP